MTVEQGLVAELNANVGVTALISDRVFPEQLPQQAVRPAVVYLRDSTEREQTLGGQSGLIVARERVDCWATTYAECWSLANAVRSALVAVSTDLGGFTVQGVDLDFETNISELDGDRRDFRVSQEYLVYYVEV